MVLQAENLALRVGHSRFDFLLKKGNDVVFMEVKSVTLFGNGLAMFPDAVTERGRRHLDELASLGQSAPRPTVLFLIHNPDVRWFLPECHADLAFAHTLLEVRDALRILPVCVGWNRSLELEDRLHLAEIPWDFLEREAKDRGSYLLILRLSRDKRVEIGKLGLRTFSKGFYVYVGSAMANLASRLDRHLRKRKNFHWHIDHLRQCADECLPLAIRSSRRLECELADALRAVLTPSTTGFGCSDCACATHLFYSPEHPLHAAGFHGVLQRFRMPSGEYL